MSSKQCVLIFYPSTTPYLGLWRPHHTKEWHTLPVNTLTKEGNVLLRHLDAFLKAENLKLSDITHIGSMPGPGSYTQIRLFVATANALAWARELPLFVLHADDTLPAMLGELLAEAKVNVPIEPIYPQVID